MVFDSVGLFFGAAFAVFLALLAWGDLIRKPRKDVAELEDEFRRTFGINKSVLSALFRKPYEPGSKQLFLEQSRAIVKIIHNKKIRGNMSLFEELKTLNALRNKLEDHYKARYFMTIDLCIVLFAFGVASIIIDSVSVFGINIAYAYLLIVLEIIGLVLKNLIDSYQIEDQFVEAIYDVYDKMEVRADGG